MRTLLLLLLLSLPALAETTPAPVRAVRLALVTEPPQLDSIRASDTLSGLLLGHLFEGLVRFGKGSTIAPGVAETWKITEKGAVFPLRRTARWSDGAPVPARDFLYAWRQVVSPATG